MPTKEETFAAIHNEAHYKGMNAGNAHTPAAIEVRDVGTGRRWAVPEGVCGFAWVAFKGNTAFGRWAKQRGVARSGYGGGLQVWVREFGQSMERKEAYAKAYAEVLNAHGITAHTGSRMD